jgi:type II secretory pathway pseudopilin PulG
MNADRPARRAFTLVELLIMIGVVALIALLLTRPAGGPFRAKAQRIKCINNLKNAALAARIFSDNNSGRNFLSVLTNMNNRTAAECFRAFSNELSTPNILVCAADKRIEAQSFTLLQNTNISYFVTRSPNLEQPQLFLFGDRNLATNGVAIPSGGIVTLSKGLNPAWTHEMHQTHGNIALGDGSVQPFTSEQLGKRVKEAPPGMTLLIP